MRFFLVLSSLLACIAVPASGMAAEGLAPQKLTVEGVQDIVDQIEAQGAPAPGAPPAAQEGAAASPAEPLEGDYPGELTRILDAQVVVIDGQRMHLLGLNAPLQTRWGRPVDCYSGEATKYLEELVKDKAVTYSYDRVMTARDPYGVKFIYLYADGKFVNAEMIQAGKAFADRVRHYKEKENFLDAEAKARRQNLGVWHVCPVECVTTGCRSKKW